MMFRSTLLTLSLIAAAPGFAQPAPPAVASTAPALRQAAEAGDAAAMAALGWRHYRGDGAPYDPAEAVKWFRAAVAKGNASGLYGLSRCLRWGVGVPQDTASGDNLMMAAAEGGDAQAQVAAGETVIDQGEREEARRRARHWYEKAAAQGNAEGLRHLGYMTLHGHGGPADAPKGLALLRQAAAMNNGIAMYYLAEAYERGDGVDVDLARARDLYRQAGEHGDKDGYAELGRFLQHGRGGERDIKEALRVYALAAEQGQADAAFALARIHSEGPDGLGINHKEMLRWLAKGVELDDKRALIWQGRIALYGGLQPADHPRAARLFARAAELGSLWGEYWYGLCLEEGKGVAKDEAKARERYRKAGVEAPLASHRLAAMLLDGRGGARDPAALHALVDQQLADGKAAAMLDLAAFVLTPQRVADGDALVKRILAHPASKAARSQPEFAKALGGVGQAYRDAERYEQAHACLEEQLALLEKLSEPQHAAIADAFEQLGYVHVLTRREKQADAAFEHSVALRVRHGKRDAALADSYAYIGDVYQLGDYFAKAERYQRLALALRQELLRPDDPILGEHRGKLGKVLFNQGRYVEAEPLLAQAVHRISAYYGDAPLLGTSLLSAWGRAQIALGRLDLAEASFRRMLAATMQGERSDPDFSRAAALHYLGMLYVKLRRFKEAEPLLQQALAIRGKAKTRTYALALTLQELGRLYQETGRHEQAQTSLERALENVMAIPEAAGWDTADILHDLGAGLARQDKYDQAAGMLERAFATRIAIQPAHHKTRESGDALAAVYRNLGKERAALEVEERMRVAVRQAVLASAGQAPG